TAALQVAFRASTPHDARSATTSTIEPANRTGHAQHCRGIEGGLDRRVPPGAPAELRPPPCGGRRERAGAARPTPDVGARRINEPGRLTGLALLSRGRA